MTTRTMLIGFLVGGRNDWVRRIPEFMPTIRRGCKWWALGDRASCAALVFQAFSASSTARPGPSPIKIVISIAYG